MEATKKLYSIGEVLARGLIFDCPSISRDTQYILCEAEEFEGLSDPKKQNSRISGHYIEDTSENAKWFMFFVGDCYFPPLYAVRADSWETAYEIFCDECAESLRIDPTSLQDYDQTQVQYSDSGVPIETDLVQGYELILKSIHV